MTRLWPAGGEVIFQAAWDSRTSGLKGATRLPDTEHNAAK